MIVRCIRTDPPDSLIGRLRPHYVPGKTSFLVEVDTEYVVLGLSDVAGAIWLEVEVGPRTIVSAPLALFTVVEPHASSYWVLRCQADGVTLWPELFYSEAFHDRLSDDKEPERRQFESLRELLLREAKAQAL